MRVATHTQAQAHAQLRSNIVQFSFPSATLSHSTCLGGCRSAGSGATAGTTTAFADTAHLATFVFEALQQSSLVDHVSPWSPLQPCRSLQPMPLLAPSSHWSALATPSLPSAKIESAATPSSSLWPSCVYPRQSNQHDMNVLNGVGLCTTHKYGTKKAHKHAKKKRAFAGPVFGVRF